MNTFFSLHNKGSWTMDEDKILIDWITEHGSNDWKSCSKLLPGRTGKQIRERWINSLNPLLKKGQWDTAEDYIIFKLYKANGAKWTEISSKLPGRTENSIKNRFYSTLRRIALDRCGDNTIRAEEILKLQKKHLLYYFNDAYEEKTLYIDKLISRYSISDENLLNHGVIKNILSMTKNESKNKNIFELNQKSFIDMFSTDFINNVEKMKHEKIKKDTKVKLLVADLSYLESLLSEQIKKIN